MSATQFQKRNRSSIVCLLLDLRVPVEWDCKEHDGLAGVGLSDDYCLLTIFLLELDMIPESLGQAPPSNARFFESAPGSGEPPH